jgi:small-conductance mechanosensitive channel
VVETRIDRIEQQLARADRRPPEPETLAGWQRELKEFGDRAQACITEAEGRVKASNEALATLGEKAPDEDQKVTDKRASLERQRREAENAITACRLTLLRTGELSTQIGEIRQHLLAEQLLARGPHLGQVVLTAFKPGFIESYASALIQAERISEVSPIDVLLVMTPVLLAALGLGLLLRRQFAPPGGTAEEGREANRVYALLRALRRQVSARMPWIATGAALGAVAQLHGMDFIAMLMFALGAYAFATAPINAILCPRSQEPFVAALLRADACRLAHRFQFTLAVAFIGEAMVMGGVGDVLGEEARLVTRTVYGIFMTVTLFWIVSFIVNLPPMARVRPWRYLIYAALLAGPVASWLGYQNLGLSLFMGVMGTLLGVGTAWLLLTAIRHLLDGLNEGRTAGGRRVRRWLGLASAEALPGMRWLRLIAFLATMTGALLWVLFVWGLSDTLVPAVLDLLVEGFPLGGIKVVPVRLAGAIVGLILLMMAARWLQRKLSETWLVGKLAPGGLEAVTNLTGYTIVLIAIIAALSIAGVSFSNLAIIAGALSVGIGFGLQNIVNNFVSGLILLFEQPIRPGDWVVVGDTEGYVRRIAIRYTLVETFDRSDVVVPNSELISNQVTNWMLRDRFGRLKVPVHIAHDADVRLASELMLRAAKEQVAVMFDDPRVPKAKVHILGIGESALILEMWCFVQDVDMRFTIRTRLYEVILRSFREHGIRFPYPQRDVHLRSVPSSGPPVSRHEAIDDAGASRSGDSGALHGIGGSRPTAPSPAFDRERT